ncbi:MAG TPA: type II toxin-antitoxin system ParD family antitoxin [Caulobacteraceae bacterium]|jgi:antitoxin ParD1/3/4
MDLRLSPELGELVREKVESGLYRDADDVLRQALEALDRDPQARRAALKAAIQKGIDDFEAGRFTAINNREELDAFFRDL